MVRSEGVLLWCGVRRCSWKWFMWSEVLLWWGARRRPCDEACGRAPVVRTDQVLLWCGVRRCSWNLFMFFDRAIHTFSHSVKIHDTQIWPLLVTCAEGPHKLFNESGGLAGRNEEVTLRCGKTEEVLMWLGTNEEVLPR